MKLTWRVLDAARCGGRRLTLALAWSAVLLLGVPAVQAADKLAPCIEQCRSDCEDETKNCVRGVTRLCRAHPWFGTVCRSVYVPNCRAAGQYCRVVGCGLITSCNPTPDPSPDRPVKGGKSKGEPHLYTHDGLAYSLQAAGEFVLAQSADGSFVVQARQEPFVGSKSVSANTAFAMRVGADRVGLYRDAPAGARINGVHRAIAVGELVDLPAGGQVERLSDADYLVTWPGAQPGEVSVSLGVWSDVVVSPPARLQGAVAGLLGNFNGRSNDDLQVRPGTTPVLPPLAPGAALDVDTLYGVFAKSWRVRAPESLFDYAEGQSTASFALPDFPERHLGLADLPADKVAAAQASCRAAGVPAGAAFEDCSFDVALSGNPALAASFKGLGPLQRLAVATPLYLDGWTQQGAPENGAWKVAAGGRAVTQGLNGDPSFFVGNRDLIDVTLRGTLQVAEAGDDDMIGFVLGFRGPFAAGQASDFVLLDWRRGAQYSDGHELEEGLRLARFKGPVDDVLAAHWGMVEGGTVRRLATALGPGKGWKTDQVHRFEARYGRERVQILIDGVKVFDVTGSFLPGRFGFYNYSQEAVTYAGFELIEGVRFD